MLGFLFVFAFTQAFAGSPPLPLKLVRDIPLPGTPSRFDYQWTDSTSRRLYIAHLGANSLVVFDLKAEKVIGEVKGLTKVHGVVSAPDQHLIFATATADKQLAVIDEKSLAVVARIPAGEYPNGLAYDPKSGRVFVSNNTGIGTGVVDTKNRKALPGIELGGGAGNTQYDSVSGHIFVTVHKAGVLVEMDPESLKVITRHELKGITSCHGLLVASDLGLAFAACSGAGPTLVTFDIKAKRKLDEQALPPKVDVLAFDPGLRRLYTASEDTGVAAVFELGADRKPKKLGEGVVGSNAHSVAVDPETHRVYFPLEDVNGHPVLRVMEPGSR